MNRVTQFRDIWYDHHPGRGKRFLSFPKKDTTSSLAHPASNEHRGCFPRINWKGLDDGHSPPPTAVPRNDRKHTSAPSICLHGVNRDVSFFGAFAKLRKATINFVLSVCLSVSLSVCLSICPSARPQGTSLLPLDGFSWNLIFEDFFKKNVYLYFLCFAFFELCFCIVSFTCIYSYFFCLY